METIQTVVSQLLPLVDAHPDREGLRDTPKRYEKFLKEFLKPDAFNLTTFANEGYDEMVLQANIPFYSICEHHLVPFFGIGAIAYIPGEKIVGLSKLARTLDHFSRRLQNQERITTEVASFLMETLSPKGVGVVLQARHLCMEMRGIQKPGVQTSTSCLKGNFKSRPETRAEFLRLATTV
jgi:GTP cyclohydrolase I